MHILLVEDHAESRDVIGRLLVHCGHTVDAVGTRAEASSLLGQKPFQALLADIGLPDGDVFDLVTQAKTIHGVKMICALTGRNGDDDRTRGQEAGFDFYLTKPVDFHVLRSLLQHARV